jgi:DNA-binding Lrp family transcriptional regulator
MALIKKLSEKERMIIYFIEENKSITFTELSKRTGVSKRTVDRFLKEMKEKKIINESVPIKKVHGKSCETLMI